MDLSPLMIACAAGAWSLCMIGFGLANNFPLALSFLVLAGYADMISGVFRQTIWNQTIPTELRGRLAGIEMISYLTGPMLGNTQLGFLANAIGVRRAITFSSCVGVFGVVACARLLPGFRNYVAENVMPTPGASAAIESPRAADPELAIELATPEEE